MSLSLSRCRILAFCTAFLSLRDESPPSAASAIPLCVKLDRDDRTKTGALRAPVARTSRSGSLQRVVRARRASQQRPLLRGDGRARGQKPFQARTDYRETCNVGDKNKFINNFQINNMVQVQTHNHTGVKYNTKHAFWPTDTKKQRDLSLGK